jgi:hypothetical protein
MATAGTTGRWTRRFAIASALSMVALQFAFLVDAPLRTVALVGLFGAVLPMVFGMAYLLFPSYLGETLASQRLPALHFGLTYAAVGVLVGRELLGLGDAALALGTILWSLSIVLFVGTLLHTVLPVFAADPGLLLPTGTRSRRSTRLSGVVLPVAVGYLLVGTGVLLSMAPGFPFPTGLTFPVVVHFYATGFVALLIFALGVRLLIGYFHVDLPRPLSWLVLGAGATAPGILAANFRRPPWFFVGAGLETVAVAGYAALVAVVVSRTERRRVGLYGIGLGALGVVLGVGIAVGIVSGVGSALDIGIHVALVLNGFLLPTIIGYADQFFAVTSGQFRGATEQSLLAVFWLLGVGTGLHVVGLAAGTGWLRILGACLAVVGTSGYAYLLVRRLV